MIPFGLWHPDVAGINTPVCRTAQNCLPAAHGFRPLRGPAPVTDALPARCQGAVTVRLSDGSSQSFAGTSTGLYRLDTGTTWTDVSRTSGGVYATPVGERWDFAVFGDLLLATNFIDAPQKFDLTSATNFSALGGSPPASRYITVIRDQVFLGGLFGDEKKVKWSGINNAEQWTPGTNSSGAQDLPQGGPVTGLVGGETGYAFQYDAATRMTFVPGSAAIYQFDEVEGGRGLVAPHSLIRLGREAFYRAADGFYRFDLGSGSSRPIGVAKWSKWFDGDLRAGTELEILSAISPQNRVVMFPYISRSNSGTIPDKILIYDWALDEATTAVIAVEAVAQWLTGSVTLDGMNSFGNLDTLPYSLDSPFWKGGRSIIGLIGDDHKLAHLDGANLQANFETADGQSPTRSLITGTRPHVDSTETVVSVSMREADGDTVVFGDYESMEDTGMVPAHVSGNLARARVQVPAAATWEVAKGIETEHKTQGSR